MNLRECFDKHGSDKGTKRHRYDVFYEPIFSPRRYGPVRILEIGIFGGASLSAWLDYFPQAEVIGVDTFQRVPPERIEVLKHRRVSWWKLDSTMAAPDIEPVDFIIDDGSHKSAAQLATLLLYRPLLRADGSYFIEDVTDIDAFNRYAKAYRGNACEYLIEIK
jgi:cephalosporin hydroxylase